MQFVGVQLRILKVCDVYGTSYGEEPCSERWAAVLEVKDEELVLGEILVENHTNASFGALVAEGQQPLDLDQAVSRRGGSRAA